MPKTIPVVSLTANAVNTSRGGRLPFPASFPWARVTEPVRETPEEAYADAEAALDAYIKSAPWSRMGDVIGVTPRPGGYVGVINYYHSNS